MKIFIALLLLVTTSTYAATPFVIGIAGGTGSGKTTLAKTIQEALGESSVLIEQDCYYKDLSHLDPDVAALTNFDHPESLDFARLYQDILALKSSTPIQKPNYSFITHTRTSEVTQIDPAHIVIVEGILIFADESLRNLFDLKIFIETDSDIRILRRIERDMLERGRDFPSIRDQYLTTVKPMHSQFVEPSKQYADMIILGDVNHMAVLSLILSGVDTKIKQKETVKH